MSRKADFTEQTRSKLASLASALAAVQDELTLPQLLTLITIATEPGLSVNELADRLSVPQQTASRYVATLAGRYQRLFGSSDQDGDRSSLPPLVTQEISQSDPRRRALFISKQGGALLTSIAKQLGNG
jgi:DNA-binding MarR family transcriptional regulator